MMFTRQSVNSMMMHHSASAHRAEASSCVSCSANNSIALIMDAIIMASIIIIFALISRLAVLALNIGLLILVLLAVLLVLVYPYKPKT